MAKAIIYIYDFIGSEAVNANTIREIVANYEAQGVKEFELHINSNGGSVFEGIAIYNFLKTRDVVVYVDGLAASIASVIAMAGKKIYMYKSTMMMIHNPLAFDAGDEEQLKKTADALAKIKTAIVEAYHERTKLPKKEIEDLMTAETWMPAGEAVKKGFADEVVKIKEVKNYIGIFSNVIDDESNINKNKGASKMNKQLLAFLGLNENATDEQVTAKLAELKKKYELKDDATIEDIINAVVNLPAGKAGAAEKDPTPPAQNNNSGEFKDARLDKFLEEQRKDKAEALVNKAIEDKKILPADKDVYLTAALNDFDKTKAQLDARAKNSAIPGKVTVDENGKLKGGEEKENSLTKAANFFKEQGRVPAVNKK